MEFISFSILLSLIVISDEIFNGQYKLSKRLLNWLDQIVNQTEQRNK
jgi:hypothetical protein